MTSILLLRIVFTIFLILTSIFQFPSVESKNIGFTTNLIRRDYPQKDVLSSKSEYFEWMSRSVSRLFSRAAYLNHVLTKQSAASRIIDSPLDVISDGTFVMEIGIGTPPVTVHLTVDTAKELTWTQCKPCKDCYDRKDLLYDTNKTSSYKQLSCKSLKCKALAAATCDESNKCRYKLGTGFFKQRRADVAVETFTFGSSDGSNVSFPNIAFGCGHHMNTSGSIGLNRGALSLVNQLGLTTISRKFSYCIAPIGGSSKSKISFGVDPFPAGSKVKSTPLIKRPDNLYHITLEGVSSIRVGNVSDTFKSPGPGMSWEGNMIIDSEVAVTLLPERIYHGLKTELLLTIEARPIKEKIGFGPDELCYKKDSKLELPQLVFHFSGADVVIPPERAFIEYDEDVFCLVLASAGNGVAVLGNLAQINYLIEYDLDNDKLSFLQTDCAMQY